MEFADYPTDFIMQKAVLRATFRKESATDSKNKTAKQMKIQNNY